MPSDPQVSQIVNVPPNESQPNYDDKLEDSLSKLFDVPENKTATIEAVDKKDDVSGKQVEPKPEEPAKDLPNKSEVSKPDQPEEEFKTKPNKEGWKVLRDSHAKAKQTIKEKDDELSKLKLSLADKGQTTSHEAESLKKEIEELKSYRGMVDIQADPEFMQKFDEPIAKRTDQITKMLTEWGVDASIISKIDYTDTGLIERVETIIAENKDKISAKKFLRLAEEVNDLYDKRTEHLDEYRKNYKTLLETKKKETFTKQAESEGRVQKRLTEISQLKDDKGEVQFPFLNEMTAKDPANAAEVEKVDRHNKAVAFMKEKLDGALKAETPEEKADVAVAAVAAHWATAQLRAALKKIESLQTELGKISKSTTETPRSQKTTVNRSGNNENLSVDDALSSFMNGVR